MYSVINKSVFLTLIVLLALLCTACNSEEKRRHAEAQALAAEVEAMLAAKDYDQAFVLMDSVDQAYPTELEVRRQVSRLRQQAMGDYAEWQIYLCDSVIAATQGPVDELSNQFRHISGGDISGYYVLAQVYKPDFMAKSGIEGRIDDETYRFYLVAYNSAQPKVGINRISLSNQAGSVDSATLPDGSDRMGDTDKYGFDLATFYLDEVTDVAEWLLDNPGAVKVTLSGVEGTHTLDLSAADAKALAETWQFAQAASKLYQARLSREKFERQLIIARDHAVNLE